MIPSKAELKKMCREWVIGQLRDGLIWDAVFDDLKLTDEEVDQFFESADRIEAQSETSNEIIAAIEALKVS